MDAITFIMEQFDIAEENRRETEVLFNGETPAEHIELSLMMLG